MTVRPVIAHFLFAGLIMIRITGCSSSASHSMPEVPPEITSSDIKRDMTPDDVDAPKSRELFVDATTAVGIDFVHDNGTTGDFLLPEITGSGAALFDFDNDGDLDVYLVQGGALKPDREQSPSNAPRDRLFRNELMESGELRFSDVTEASGIMATGYGMGVATGDFNNDGWVDIYVTNLGDNQLWQNGGNGTFREVTENSGGNDPSWSTSAAFFDYDNDGWLDLYIVNYVNFSIDLKRECFARSSARDYCGPDSYEPSVDRLLHNLGNGTFEDVSVNAGLKQAIGAGLGVVCADFNGDGWTDVYVSNDGDPNQLWVNRQGTGNFTDESLLAGAAINQMGQAEAGMGVDAADFDGDGDMDLFMTHLEGESNTLYVNSGDGMFDDRTVEFGLHAPSLSRTSFGTRFFDYDNNGWLDLFVLNGSVRIIERLAQSGDTYPLHQPNQLFRNQGGKSFVEISSSAGEAMQLSEVSRGAAFGDIDNDGDTDVVVLNNNGRARMLLNQVGTQSHWIGLRVLSADGKRDALHATLEIVGEDGKVTWRRVCSDGSYCSSSDPRVIVGLANAGGPVTVRVRLIDGQTAEWKDLAVDRYWILQPEQAAKEVGKE